MTPTFCLGIFLSCRWFSNSAYNESIPSSSLLGPDSTTISKMKCKFTLSSPLTSIRHLIGFINLSPHYVTEQPVSYSTSLHSHRQSVTVQTLTTLTRHLIYFINLSTHYVTDQPVSYSTSLHSHRQSVTVQAVTTSTRHRSTLHQSVTPLHHQTAS